MTLAIKTWQDAADRRDLFVHSGVADAAFELILYRAMKAVPAATWNEYEPVVLDDPFEPLAVCLTAVAMEVARYDQEDEEIAATVGAFRDAVGNWRGAQQSLWGDEQMRVIGVSGYDD